MTFIERQIMPEIAKDTPPKAVAVFGPRRVGKTTMLEMLVGTSEARWYNAEAPRAIRELQFDSVGDVKTALLSYPTIVIDEAHKVPNIGNIVKLMVDVNEHLERPARIFLTSSSAFYLADVKESALGRVISRQMWPFSISEIAQQDGWGATMNNLEQYMIYGLMPPVVRGPNGAREFLTNYVEGLMFRDIFNENVIRKRSRFENLAKILAEHVGSEVSYDSLARECGIDRTTVEDYVDMMQQASIIRVCTSYSKNLTNELKKGKKIYFFDNGIRNALINDFSPLSSRPDAGALWENFFFMERVKLHDTLRDFTNIYFWRSTGNAPAEVDFVEVLDRKIHAFECKLSDKTKKSRGQKLFQETYPDSQIEIVHPSDCRRLFGAPIVDGPV